MFKVEHKYNPAERALNCSLALGIHLNLSHESYGTTTSVIAMIGDEVLFHSTQSETITWLCGLHLRLSAILSLLKAEGIKFDDSDSAIKCLEGTVQSKSNKEFYQKYILPRAGEIEL